MPGSLQFDAPTHTYRSNGVVVPSVTQVLKAVGIIDYGGIPESILEPARNLGTMVHLATELWDLGELDESALDGALIPYLMAWKSFRSERVFGPDLIERRFIANVNGMTYGGTLDRTGTLDGAPWLIDIKSAGEPDETAWPIQTAAYALGLPRPTISPFYYSRAAVQLRDDGSWRFFHYTDKSDETVFLAALAVTIYRMNKGGLKLGNS